MATAVGWLGGPPAPAVEGLQDSHEPVGLPDRTSNGHLKQHKGGSKQFPHHTELHSFSRGHQQLSWRLGQRQAWPRQGICAIATDTLRFSFPGLRACACLTTMVGLAWPTILLAHVTTLQPQWQDLLRATVCRPERLLPQRRNYCDSHFVEKETEAQRSTIHSIWGDGLARKPALVWSADATV